MSPCRAKTYQTNPLQSNPDGSAPPFLYGTPRSPSAVAITLPAGASAEGTTSGGAGLRWASGVGKGRGTAPVDAQAAPPAHVRQSRILRRAARMEGCPDYRPGAAAPAMRHDVLSKPL